MSKQMESIINQIRNILRKEGITGMDSVAHCIVLVVFRTMTPELCRSVGMDESLAFDRATVDEEGNELGAQEQYDKFYYRGNKQLNFVGEFVNRLKFANFKFKMEGIHNLKTIIDQLKQLNISDLNTKYDMIGTIYELHLKSGTSKGAMRDLGQYYTHRMVIQYMIQLCDPIVRNGIVEKIVDPTMGTGGFLTMAIKHLNKRYAENPIDWKKNKNSIIGFDIDDNVKNMALLNVFLETGHLFKDTVVRQDTLHHDMMFPQSGEILAKADVILANEPMGLKNIVHANCCERIKELKIRGTKAEPLFMQLFMEALNDGGRCAVIVPDGVLFNDSAQHTGTRKYLIESFNLKKVIGLKDSDFFLNTGVKTSILFFAKDGTKTKEVDFCEITLIGDEIVETSQIRVPYEDILAKNYTLFVNKYNTEEIMKIEGLEYKKLGDICDFLKKSNRHASYGKTQGTYPFYSSSLKTKLCDEADYNEESIIIGTGGTANIKYDTKFSCSSDNFILNSKQHNTRYIYHYLQSNLKLLENGFSGSTIKHISKEYVKNLEIPVPPLKVQAVIVERLDVLSECNQTMGQNIEQLKKIIKYYVECAVKDCKTEKMGNLCELKAGRYNSCDCKETGKYPFYNSKALNPDGYTDNYCFDYPEYLILIKDGGAGYKKYGDQIGLGKVFKVTGKSSATSHQLALIIKKTNLTTNYLYYFLTSIKNELMDLAQYTTGLGTIKKSKLEEYDIPLPSKERQMEIVAYCDNLTDLIHRQEQQIESNNLMMRQIMDDRLNARASDESNQSNESVPLENNSTSDQPIDDAEDDNESIDTKKIGRKTSKIKSVMVNDDDETEKKVVVKGAKKKGSGTTKVVKSGTKKNNVKVSKTRNPADRSTD